MANITSVFTQTLALADDAAAKLRSQGFTSLTVSDRGNPFDVSAEKLSTLDGEKQRVILFAPPAAERLLVLERSTYACEMYTPDGLPGASSMDLMANRIAFNEVKNRDGSHVDSLHLCLWLSNVLSMAALDDEQRLLNTDQRTRSIATAKSTLALQLRDQQKIREEVAACRKAEEEEEKAERQRQTLRLHELVDHATDAITSAITADQNTTPVYPDDWPQIVDSVQSHWRFSGYSDSPRDAILFRVFSFIRGLDEGTESATNVRQVRAIMAAVQYMGTTFGFAMQPDTDAFGRGTDVHAPDVIHTLLNGRDHFTFVDFPLNSGEYLCVNKTKYHWTFDGDAREALNKAVLNRLKGEEAMVRLFAHVCGSDRPNFVKGGTQ